MIIRQLSSLHDWTFGQGRNNYVTGNAAVAQNINTRLLMFLGDCFFDLGAGIDWWNFLGSKNQTGLQLAISATIINTANVTGLLQSSLTLDANRILTINYSVQSSYSVFTNTFQYDLNGIG